MLRDSRSNPSVLSVFVFLPVTEGNTCFRDFFLGNSTGGIFGKSLIPRVRIAVPSQKPVSTPFYSITGSMFLCVLSVFHEVLA